MKNFIFYFLVVVAIGSCDSGRESTSNLNNAGDRLFEELLKTTKLYNDTTTGSKITLSHNGNNPTKEIFHMPGNRNRLHVLYLFTWDNNLPRITNNFKAILLDVDTREVLYSYRSPKSKTIQNEDTLPKSFENEKFVLLKYKANQIEFLKTLQNRFSSAEIGSDYMIYEVNLVKRQSRATLLNSISILANELGQKNGS